MVEVSGRADGGIELRPSGALCHFQLGPLRAAFDAASEFAATEIRIDLADVTLLSSSAVAFLEDAAQACAARNLRFTLVNVDGLSRRVVEVLGATSLVERYTSVGAA